MLNVIRGFTVFLLLGIWASAQQTNTYAIEQKTALVGAAEAITVQLSAAATVSVSFNAASVYCSVQCEVTLERDGTAATATAITVQKLNSDALTGSTTAYRASNVGAGTVFGRDIVPAGATAIYDLSNKRLRAGQNLTIKTDSITGTVIISATWQEKR